MTIRARPTPPSYKVVDQMAKSDERAARLDSKVKRFARSEPERKPYNTSMATSPVEAPESTGDLHAAFVSVGDQMLQYHDKPASLATVGHAFKQVAMKIKPEEPNIGPSVAPKRVSAPEIGERDTSGLFGEQET
jgi:hypothetical protein